jgi:hypothetical protein
MSASGLSQAGLERMRQVLTGHVTSGDVPGLVALVARRGEVHVVAAGTAEAGGGAPMQRDAIFRIASVSKQIAAAHHPRCSATSGPAPERAGYRELSARLVWSRSPGASRAPQPFRGR